MSLICDPLEKNFIQSSSSQNFQSRCGHFILWLREISPPGFLKDGWCKQHLRTTLKMVAQIKLCKRSCKITCSSFSAFKMDLQSICHVTPGSSGISAGSEGSKPQIILKKNVFEILSAQTSNSMGTITNPPSTCPLNTDLSPVQNKQIHQALLEVFILGS